MMPELTETTLVSAAKLAEVGYVSIFDNDEVNVYGTYNIVITVKGSSGNLPPFFRLSKNNWREDPLNQSKKSGRLTADDRVN